MAPIYIMIDQEETGRNILNLMNRQGLKVRDIQEACGFEQPQAVYKWLHGQSLPSIDNLLILAKLFESTVEGILATSEDALPHFYNTREISTAGPNAALYAFFYGRTQRRGSRIRGGAHGFQSVQRDRSGAGRQVQGR